MNNLSLAVLILLLLAASVCDLRWKRIPNVLTFSGIIISLMLNTVINGMNGLLFSLAGAGFGLALLLPFYILGGMGAGDVKLMGAVGGFLGAKGVLYAFLLTAVAGGIYAVVLMIFAGGFRKTASAFVNFLYTRKFAYASLDGRTPKLCYGVAIAIGTAFYIAADTFKFGFIT